jgi:hypothetical protein
MWHCFSLELTELEGGRAPHHRVERGARVVVSRQYRCEAASVEGFVQQLVNYLSKGYLFYVTGWIPEAKNPKDVDRKLIGRYDLAISQWTRSRRKKAGRANAQYLRYGQFFVLIATHGRHLFFEREADQFKDVREVSIKFEGYSISYRPSTATGSWHASVRIDREPYLELKAYLVELATRRRADDLARVFRWIRFEPYAPVRRQLLNILRAVNRERKSRGFSPLPYSVIRMRRKLVKPFGEAEAVGEAA